MENFTIVLKRKKERTDRVEPQDLQEPMETDELVWYDFIYLHKVWSTKQKRLPIGTKHHH